MATLLSLLSWIRSVCSVASRLEPLLSGSLGCVVFGLNPPIQKGVLALWRALADPQHPAHNPTYQHGQWKQQPRPLNVRVITAAPLATLMSALSNPFVADADPVGVSALLACHGVVTSSTAFMGALGEVYKL
jgi:hypothetical protein